MRMIKAWAVVETIFSRNEIVQEYENECYGIFKDRDTAEGFKEQQANWRERKIRTLPCKVVLEE